MKTFTTLAIAAVFALGIGAGAAHACGPKPAKDSACGCDGAKDTAYKPAAAGDAKADCGCGAAADDKIAKKDDSK
jgi:hypothetical protein